MLRELPQRLPSLYHYTPGALVARVRLAWARHGRAMGALGSAAGAVAQACALPMTKGAPVTSRQEVAALDIA